MKNKKILVIDDQEDLREQLAQLLRKAGQKNTTHSLVEQMRARLLGKQENEDEDIEELDSKFTYTVDTASQGEEAFNMVKEANDNNDSYSVMFLDMRMPPGWDGLETATKIREIDKNIEIVIMTAYADHDQEEIADKVGVPEKLLYIKKPFQPEEIYQLALSLTSKYSLELTEKNRKIWLQSLLRGMSKLKSSILSKNEVFNTVLTSILNFTGAKTGIIAELNTDLDKWENYASIETTEEDAIKYFQENSKSLKESRTTQKLEDKYILPLIKEHLFVVVVIDHITPPTDPEWYKLLSLLMMTCSELLNNSHIAQNNLKKREDKGISEALNSLKKDLENIKSESNSINSENIEVISDKVAELANKALTTLQPLI